MNVTLTLTQQQLALVLSALALASDAYSSLHRDLSEGLQKMQEPEQPTDGAGGS